MAFKGIKENSLLLNLASIEHNPNESESMEINKIKYE
jgi:dTDP-4-dehydrorhamnose 3,5-epimerase